MVIKNSRVNGAFPFCDIFAEAIEKPRLINIVIKYLGFLTCFTALPSPLFR